MYTIKKRDADKSRKLILDAAETLFAKKGYHQTTLSEIAELSGLSRTTPSYFFRNKEQLYRRVIERLIKTEKEYVNTSAFIEGEVTVEALRIILRRRLEYTLKNPNLTKILVAESLNDNRPDWILEYYPEMISWSYAYLEEAKASGKLASDIDIDALWINALAMAWLPIITEHTFGKVMGKDIASEEYIQNQKQQVETMMFRSILPVDKKE